MKTDELKQAKIEGKTYSLFGNSDTTEDYYQLISSLADNILENNPDISFVIEILNRYSSKKRYLQKILRNPLHDELISDWINLIDSELKQFTQKTEEHLKSLPLSKSFDKRLATTREQYHLYMLEIELTNRLNSAGFKNANRKIALTPYCLQDFTVSCKAAKKGFDYQCKSCSSVCFQNHASSTLKKNNIEPFIWMGGSIKEMATSTLKSGQSLGILGIACIPELVWGIRKCYKYKIPVVGIPLNSNRCIRWFGEFFPNSVNLDELEKLVS
jgi:hypothetical protein